MTTPIRTTCPYCGVGCGVLAKHPSDGRVEIAGDPEHPANFGRLCSKGAALGETLSLEDRLLTPLIHGTPATWDAALDLVANRFRETIDAHGAASVAFYVSGQILTEDYYVANKLMKGYIGTANIDTNSRLCMASSVAGHKRAFGSDTVPGCYEDLDEADLVVLVGSNLAWCHPVLFQRLTAAKERRGTKVVVIDPRRTATCEIADMHLAIAPGSDVMLFNGLLQHIAAEATIDRAFVWRHTSGLLSALKAAQDATSREIATTTGLSRQQISEFYNLFTATERVVTVYSQGVNQSMSGTDKVNAIINCHLATGRIGKPGMGPFSVTGQPNAMGGREVGGLANMLAAHMELSDADHRRIVQSFWCSPRIADAPGLKAVDMFRAVADGRIKAIWIMATNPVDSMPDANAVRAALEGCPFVVVSEVERDTDTMALAHVALPSAAWGEKSGTITNSERRISRQRAVLQMPGDARPDWWQMAQVAQRLGFGDGFAWETPADIFAEYARLTAMENDGSRDLDLSDVADLSPAAYDALTPRQWPRQRARLFADGQFFTSDARARFIPTPFRGTAEKTTSAYPLVLNTGRIRDQWHTMTRTARTPRLMSHIAEPFIEVHPVDAQRYGLAPAGLAEVTSPRGRAVLRVVVTDRQRRGSVFAPIHWTDRMSATGRIDALIAGDVDPVSGQPELKATPVAIAAFDAAWYGFAVMREKPERLSSAYWALARAAGGWRVELADLNTPADWPTAAHEMLTLDDDTDMLAYRDVANGGHRFAAFEQGRLVAALFIARDPVAVSRSWLAAKLTADFPDARSRIALLAGRGGAAEKDKGAIVCSCFEVGATQISDAAREGSNSIADVGVALKAGTNCGSCRAEIGRLINAVRVPQAV